MTSPQPVLGPLPRVRLVAPLRRTESGSGTFLALASDGRQYWVKSPENPQGNRTLVTEIVVQGVGALLGAPVVPTALVDIPPRMTYSYTRQDRLHGGLGHGSLNVSTVIQSDAWSDFSSHDDNRNRQARLLALWDLCMGGDPQWLYDVLDDYSVWSFDHGFWLGGEGDWDEGSLTRTATSRWDDELSAGIASAAGLRAAAEAVSSLTRDDLRGVVARVPVEWGATSRELVTLVDVLYLRADGVASRLLEAAERTNFD